MKKSLLKLLCVSAISVFALSGAFADKKPWAEVAAPTITKVEQTGPNEIKVSFNSLTNNDGADKGSVSYKSDTGASGSEAYGKTRKEAKNVVFTLSKSGTLNETAKKQKNSQSLLLSNILFLS